MEAAWHSQSFVQIQTPRCTPASQRQKKFFLLVMRLIVLNRCCLFDSIKTNLCMSTSPPADRKPALRFGPSAADRYVATRSPVRSALVNGGTVRGAAVSPSRQVQFRDSQRQAAVAPPPSAVSNSYASIPVIRHGHYAAMQMHGSTEWSAHQQLLVRGDAAGEYDSAVVVSSAEHAERRGMLRRTDDEVIREMSTPRVMEYPIRPASAALTNPADKKQYPFACSDEFVNGVDAEGDAAPAEQRRHRRPAPRSVSPTAVCLPRTRSKSPVHISPVRYARDVKQHVSLLPTGVKTADATQAPPIGGACAAARSSSAAGSKASTYLPSHCAVPPVCTRHHGTVPPAGEQLADVLLEYKRVIGQLNGMYQKSRALRTETASSPTLGLNKPTNFSS